MRIRSVNMLLASLLTCVLALAACSPPIQTPTASPSATDVPASETSSSPTPTLEPTVSPTPGCPMEQGQLEQSSYHSSQLDREVPLWVYKPPCFPLPNEELPVVFFFHGKPFDQTHWVELGLVDSYQRGLSTGRWPRVLLILPRLPEPLFSSSDGGPGSYEQEFLEVALPIVEERYPMKDGALSLAGISRGGIWSLEIGLSHPQLFNKIAALSPSLAVNYPRERYDPFYLATSQESYRGEVMLLAGEDDWARPKTAELAADLEQAGARVHYQLVTGSHQDRTWQQALPDVLDFLLAPGESQ